LCGVRLRSKFEIDPGFDFLDVKRGARAVSGERGGWEIDRLGPKAKVIVFGSGGARLLGQLAGEEVADDRRDLRSLALQREMTGIEQMNFRIWIVALERFSAGRQEERIILAPDREKRWPLRAKILLKFRVERDVALIVTKQIELDLVIAGSSELGRVARRSQECRSRPARASARRNLRAVAFRCKADQQFAAAEIEHRAFDH
jgi:hypothetical protein